jgi:hypothetical protein
VQRVEHTHCLHLFYICVGNYITPCTSCKATHIVYVCFMHEHTTILHRVHRVEQYRPSTSVLCMIIQLYYLVYNYTHSLHLFYVCAYNYIASCKTCKRTHILYMCFIYVRATIFLRVQRVEPTHIVYISFIYV